MTSQRVIKLSHVKLYQPFLNKIFFQHFLILNFRIKCLYTIQNNLQFNYGFNALQMTWSLFLIRSKPHPVQKHKYNLQCINKKPQCSLRNTNMICNINQP